MKSQRKDVCNVWFLVKCPNIMLYCSIYLMFLNGSPKERWRKRQKERNSLPSCFCLPFFKRVCINAGKNLTDHLEIRRKLTVKKIPSVWRALPPKRWRKKWWVLQGEGEREKRERERLRGTQEHIPHRKTPLKVRITWWNIPIITCLPPPLVLWTTKVKNNMRKTSAVGTC